ncbi:hypothetical protein AGMMS50276_15460 [Synergistales bacterium]|nr:hypothetical protein AGMMS50276_15460 [Synergistales bacterium]
MKPNTKKFVFLSLFYLVFCYAPFFVPALNTPMPIIWGFPFTVWYIAFAMMMGCAILYWGTKHVWDGFDAGLEDNTATSGKNMEEIGVVSEEGGAL